MKQFPHMLPLPAFSSAEAGAIAVFCVGSGFGALFVLAHYVDRYYGRSAPSRAMSILAHFSGWIILIAIAFAMTLLIVRLLYRLLVHAPPGCRTVGQIAVCLAAHSSGDPTTMWNESELWSILRPLVGHAFAINEEDVGEATPIGA